MTDDGRLGSREDELDRIRRLAASPDLALRLSLTRLPSTLPDDVWAKLMRDHDPRVPSALASQPGATTRQLEQLVMIWPVLRRSWVSMIGRRCATSGCALSRRPTQRSASGSWRRSGRMQRIGERSSARPRDSRI